MAYFRRSSRNKRYTDSILPKMMESVLKLFYLVGHQRITVPYI